MARSADREERAAIKSIIEYLKEKNYYISTCVLILRVGHGGSMNDKV